MQDLIEPGATLADLSVRHAGASRVFHRHGLDFCCHGRVALEQACRERGLDPAAIRAELEQEIASTPQGERVADAPLPDLVQHILDRFHAGHREEVPRLIAMARKVEEVHGDKPACPRGLADLLERVAGELEEHMQKEEQVLFPMLVAGHGARAGMPISVLEAEHDDHGQNLARLRALASDYVPPAEACNTWRALYLGLAELERELMEHFHLENNALFPRALRG
jgi:regulator of cell morphogenesis and NO signaling